MPEVPGSKDRCIDQGRVNDNPVDPDAAKDCLDDSDQMTAKKLGN